MRQHGQHSPHGQDHPPVTSSSWMKRGLLIVCGIMALLIARNVFTRDYTKETKTFLTSIGRADAIENVVPKTFEDIQAEKKKQVTVFDQLVANMTVVMTQYQGLRADVDRLQKGEKGENGEVGVKIEVPKESTVVAAKVGIQEVQLNTTITR